MCSLCCYYCKSHFVSFSTLLWLTGNSCCSSKTKCKRIANFKATMLPVLEKPFVGCGRMGVGGGGSTRKCISIWYTDREMVAILCFELWMHRYVLPMWPKHMVCVCWKSNNTNARLMASTLSLALDPTFGIHSHKTLDIAQPCLPLKPNWKPSCSHTISILTNISTQFLLQSMCVCVCVCSAFLFYFIFYNTLCKLFW